jgi:hypothetical protein
MVHLHAERELTIRGVSAISGTEPVADVKPMVFSVDKPTNRKVKLANRLIWISPLAGFLSALLTGAIYLLDNFGGTPSSALIVAYGFAVAVFAIPPIWLLWTIYRHRAKVSGVAGLRTMATIVAVACLLFGSLISGQALVRVIADEVDSAILRSNGPTPAEISYTPQQLHAASENLIDESLSALSLEPAFREGDILEPIACGTSNGYRGTSFLGTVGRQTPATDADFRAAVVAKWEQMGLTITSAPDELDANRMATVSATGDFLERDIEFHLTPDGSVKLTFETICVIGDLD